MRFANWTGPAGVLRWYGVAVGGFLLIRATSTLAGGASFSVPGTGWRSLFQLVAVAILVVGIVRPKVMRIAVAAVTVIYLLATVSELVNGTVLLGAIPVDMRDRVVHPLIAILGAAALYLPMAVAGVRLRARKLPDHS
ncbi:MAG TPA: hypothetical protein VFI65_19775 [Streptosporangiaceae bacterium]|nr:hypothetical protein [Streptosporangiaceae bacterium]